MLITNVKPFSMEVNNDGTYFGYKLVDLDKYEVKEKPEAKKARLEIELKTAEGRKSYFQSQVDYWAQLVIDQEEKIKEIQDALKKAKIGKN